MTVEVNVLRLLHKVKHTLQDENVPAAERDPQAIYRFKYDNARVGDRYEMPPMRFHRLPPRPKP